MSRTDTLSRYRTTITGTAAARTLTVRYIATDIVRILPCGSIVLNSGGYRTVTTKRKMCQTAREFGLGFSVWQKDHIWYVTDGNGCTHEFRDGITLAN
jgi:hypothetical protein